MMTTATATVQYDLGNGLKEALHCLTPLGKANKCNVDSGLQPPLGWYRDSPHSVHVQKTSLQYAFFRDVLKFLRA